ncbi:cellulase family glycosylhydrolase [Pseudomonas sp. MAG002Y]|nr:cellulase family glycosylhydrolase [Pseudomonas sp. MAG002Y]
MAEPLSNLVMCMLKPLFFTKSLIMTTVLLLGCAEARAEQVSLVGLNMSGAGFAGSVLPGVNGTNYIFPVESYFQQWSSRGIKLIRFPILWERLQPVLDGPLDPTYAGLIDRTFSYAGKYNMKVILDLHNYMRYRGEIIGAGKVSYNHYQAIMTMIAQRWSGQSSLYAYDIMNEPHDALAYWPTAAQYGINGVRAIDKVRPIMVEGNGWSEATRWALWNDVLLNLKDPSNNIIFQAHSYFDDNAGGNYINVNVGALSPNYGVERVKPFIEWLKKHGKRGMIGEFGVPDNDSRWLTIIDNLLAYLQQNCIPSTYWAAGPGWGNYNLSVEPINGQDRPQWAVLKKYINDTSCINYGPLTIGYNASPTPTSAAPESASTTAATQSQLNAIQQLYLAYMGRASDKAGLEYWAGEIASGKMTIELIAKSFTLSDEYRSKYAGLNYEGLVEKVYLNVLNRTADTAGKVYWVNELSQGRVTTDVFVLAVINGLGVADKVVFDKKIATAFSIMK